MTISWRDEDPGLPIEFGQCSNGEYDPEPMTPVREEMERIARSGIDSAITRTGMGRREFLRSAASMVICLGAIDTAVSRSLGLSPGQWYPFDPGAGFDIAVSRARLGPTQFVFDVQGHLLAVSPSSCITRDSRWPVVRARTWRQPQTSASIG